MATNTTAQVEVDKQEAESQDTNETQQEFDFRLWSGPFWKDSEMCDADEVFFQGQILPLHGQRLKRCVSMSESDYFSNSLRSLNSSNSTKFTKVASKDTAQNRFHTHPSPKPQLRVPIPFPRRQACNSRNVVGIRKSSTWELFRLGVVATPEIELRDLKLRGTKNCVSRNNSSTSNSSNSNSSNSGTTKSGKSSTSSNTHYKDKSNHGLMQFVGKSSVGFLSGCKCSIETEPLNTTVLIKSGTIKGTNRTESETHAVKEKVVFELKKQKEKEKQGKKEMSRRRTFEWLEELSHASYTDDDEEILILN